MKVTIDFSKPLVAFNGKSMVDEGSNAILLSAVAVEALIGDYEDEKGLAAVKKVARAALATKIVAAKEPLELEAEDAVLVKELLNKRYGTLIVSAAYALLDA